MLKQKATASLYPHRIPWQPAGPGPGAHGARPAGRGPAVEPAAIEIRVVRTSGDVIQDRPLSEVGGKGLFTKEIEERAAAPRGGPRGAFRQGHADATSARADHRGVPAARRSARCLGQPHRPVALLICPPARVSAPARCGAPPWCDGCAATSWSCRCAETWRRGCASSTRASPTPRCWRSRACAASGWNRSRPLFSIRPSLCRRSARA